MGTLDFLSQIADSRHSQSQLEGSDLKLEPVCLVTGSNTAIMPDGFFKDGSIPMFTVDTSDCSEINPGEFCVPEKAILNARFGQIGISQIGLGNNRPVKIGFVHHGTNKIAGF